MPAPTYNAYVTAGTILNELSKPDGLKQAVMRILASGVRKVVLESYRGGSVVAEKRLRELREEFKSWDVACAGGIMPVWGRGFGKRNVGVEMRCPFFCYSDAETKDLLEAEIRKLSRLFREVVIDDALLTACRCPECDALRAGRDWGDFRREMMLEFSRRLVAAAHEENAETRLVLKLPQYYDRYHLFGYDPAAQGEVFDGIWVGTETRDPATLAYGYVEQYQPWFHVGWMRQCVGDKFQGAWYDYLDCDGRLFGEQALTTALTSPPQVTFFCYCDRMFDKETGFARQVPVKAYGALAERAREPLGVHALKPKRSDGEGDLFIFDFLGMIGIPLAPVVELDSGMSSVIVPSHGASDPETPRRVIEILDAGGQVILTFNALWRMREADGLAEAFGYDPSGVFPNGTEVRELSMGEERVELETPFVLPGDLEPKDAEAPVRGFVDRCEGGGLGIPLVTVKEHPGGGRAVVWNVGTFGHDAFPVSERLNVPERPPLLWLPQRVLDFLRNTALAPLGVELSAPARVAVFPFRRFVAFVNYTDSEAVLVLGGAWSANLHSGAEKVFASEQGSPWSDEGLVIPARSFVAFGLAATHPGLLSENR